MMSSQVGSVDNKLRVPEVNTILNGITDGTSRGAHGIFTLSVYLSAMQTMK
jgi:hypothetical protein